MAKPSSSPRKATKETKAIAIGSLIGLFVVGVAVVALGATPIVLLPIVIGGVAMLGVYGGYFSDSGD